MTLYPLATQPRPAPVALTHRPLPLSEQYPCVLAGGIVGTVIGRTSLGSMVMTLDVLTSGGVVNRGVLPCDVGVRPANVLVLPVRLRVVRP